MDPGNSKWGQRRRPWKNTYLITDREGLETDSVVGKLVEKKRLNNLARWEFSQRNGEQERSDMGESVFLETDPISLFWGLLIYIRFVTCRDEYRVTQWSAVLTFIKIRCFT